MTVIAQAAGSPAAGLAEYGPIGIIAAAALWIAWQFIKREQERSDRLEVEVRDLNQVIRNEVLPLVERAILVLDRRDQNGDG